MHVISNPHGPPTCCFCSWACCPQAPSQAISNSSLPSAPLLGSLVRTVPHESYEPPFYGGSLLTAPPGSLPSLSFFLFIC